MKTYTLLLTGEESGRSLQDILPAELVDVASLLDAALNAANSGANAFSQRGETGAFVELVSIPPTSEGGAPKLDEVKVDVSGCSNPRTLLMMLAGCFPSHQVTDADEEGVLYLAIYQSK